MKIAIFHDCIGGGGEKLVLTCARMLRADERNIIL
jgi:hypothetical protein